MDRSASEKMATADLEGGEMTNGDNRFLNMQAGHIWSYLDRHKNAPIGSAEKHVCLMLEECIQEIRRQATAIQAHKAQASLRGLEMQELNPEDLPDPAEDWRPWQG